jgi:hypothetical protein
MSTTRERPRPGQGRLFRGANGSLPLEPRVLGLKSREVTVAGGPYGACPRDAFGVCLLEAGPRADQLCAVHLPVEDFSVPADAARVTAALEATLGQLVRGHKVYVGCAGGWGRTGLFLSLLAKVAGEAEPVAYVRRHYSPRAVETEEQRAYVEQFPVAGLRRRLFWQLLVSWPGRWLRK